MHVTWIDRAVQRHVQDARMAQSRIAHREGWRSCATCRHKRAADRDAILWCGYPGREWPRVEPADTCAEYAAQEAS